ncbi:MAG: glucose 1-dehydrogenase [Acidobacteria bacterium]|nr:glucose 1-dehydrogenase [Acidobacteriota bacterium]
MRLKNKTAIVTGSSQGIGRAIALRFAGEGANVVINYNRNPQGAEEALREIEAAGGSGLIVQADLGKLADIKKLIAAAIEHFGRVDILVNNAGLETHAPFWEVSEEDYDKVLNVNLKGVFSTTQEFVRHLMLDNNHGRKGKVVNISSVHEELPFPNFSAYCASKGGLKMLTRNLAVELGSMGININNIAPGAVETPINSKLLNDPMKLGALLNQIPLGRLGQPADVSGLAVFLSSDDADYVTGATYYVDGGLTWNYQEQ